MIRLRLMLFQTMFYCCFNTLFSAVSMLVQSLFQMRFQMLFPSVLAHDSIEILTMYVVCASYSQQLDPTPR